MKNRRYTDLDREFLIGFIPGHSYKDIAAAFNKFTNGPAITESQVQTFCRNNKIRTGRTGRFQKGNIPKNKWKKTDPADLEKFKHTCFEKGHRPHNSVEVGTEVLKDDGYAWIKTEEPNIWKQKHVVLWEQKHGPVPEGSCIIFMDKNRDNLNLENLRCVTRRELLHLNRNGWIFESRDLTETGIAMADLRIAIIDRTKTERTK